MSDVKKLSSLPDMATPAQSPMAIALNGSSLTSLSFAKMLAMMLIPFAVVRESTTKLYTEDQMMNFATEPTFWGMKGMKVGDVLVISGQTSDTGKKFLYFFLSDGVWPNNKDYLTGRCFLFILEGELPLFPVFSSQ